jgi:hypothetical protein
MGCSRSAAAMSSSQARQYSIATAFVVALQHGGPRYNRSDLLRHVPPRPKPAAEASVVARFGYSACGVCRHSGSPLANTLPLVRGDELPSPCALSPAVSQMDEVLDALLGAPALALPLPSSVACPPAASLSTPGAIRRKRVNVVPGELFRSLGAYSLMRGALDCSAWCSASCRTKFGCRARELMCTGAFLREGIWMRTLACSHQFRS